MTYYGDYAPASSVVFNFNTASFADGSPITLGGTPALSVYKNSTTESTTGITLTVDYDSRTGMHHVVIDTSADGTFYAAGNDFAVVITTGTVGGTSVVGRVVGNFSLNNRSALRPATAGRTLVVDAAGLADANTVKVGPSGSGTAQTARDIGASVLLSSGTGTGQVKLSSGYVAPDWGDVGNPTTVVSLSGTTVGTVTTVTNQLTAAAIATGVWQDTTAGDFTVVSSIGKSLYTGNNAPGAANGMLIAGSNAATTFATLTSTGAFTINGTSNVAQTGDSFARIGSTGSGLTSLAPSATALSTAQWTNSLATDIGTTNSTVATNLDAAVSSRLAPTVAARTLDVSAGGEAGIDWANVGSPTTAVNLSGTTIATTQKVDVETIKTNPVVNGGTITFPTGATLASTTNITAGTVTTATNVTTVNGLANNVITAASIDSGALVAAVWDGSTAGHTTGGTFGGSLNSASSAGDPWATSLPGAYSAGSAGYIVGNTLDAAVSSRLAPTSAGRTLDVTATGAAGIDWGNIENPTTAVNLSGTNIDTDQVVASVTGAVGSVTGAVGSVTGNVGGNVTGSVGSVATGGLSRASFAADTGLQTIRSDTAQNGGGSGAIILDTGASTTDDIYNDAYVLITGGTGVGQAARLVTDYVGSSRTATITPAWVTNPDDTSTFALLHGGRSDMGAIDGSRGKMLGLASMGNDYLGGSVSAAVVSMASNTVTASALATDAVTEIATGVWGSATKEITGGTITTYTGNTPQTGDAYAVVTNGTYGNSAIQTAVAALPTATANADALLGRNIAGGSSTGRTVSTALYALRNKVSISGATMTVYSTDDTTSSWTASVTSDSGAEPLTAIDPS